MEQPPDHDLIAQTLAGDKQAFGELVARYGRDVYTLVAQMVRYPEDAEDLVQETFVRAFTHIGELKDPKSFASWLKSIARNLTRMWHRRRYVQLRLQEMLGNASAEMVNNGNQVDPSELNKVIRKALHALTEAHRQVIVHHYFKGYTYLETAQLLKLKKETVRSRLQKARHRLREEIISMNGQDIQKQTFELTREDINVLRWASKFASRDEKRLILQGVYLDTGGGIVVSDGRRLLTWHSDRLKEISAPVLLGPIFDVEIPQADRATLSIKEREAIVSIPGKKDVTVPFIEGSYVQYEQVIPKEWNIQVKVRTDQLLTIIDLIGDHIVTRHPTNGEGMWKYQPQVEIHLSVPHGTLTLVKSPGMDYNRMDEKGKSHYWKGDQVEGVDWKFTTSIPAQIETDETEFRIGANPTYLSDAVRALQTVPSEDVYLRLIDPLKAMIFSPVQHPDRKSLLMPLRLMIPDDNGG